jgi:O-antigen ligase
MANHLLQPRAPGAPLASPMPIVVAGLFVAGVIGIALAVNLQLGAGALLLALYGPIALLDLAFGIVVWIPTSFLARLSQVGAGPTVMMIVIGIAWLGSLSVRGPAVAQVLRRQPAMFGLLAAMLLWMALSTLWATDVGAAGEALVSWAVAAATFCVLATTLTERRYVVMACWAFVVGAFLSVVVGLVPGATASFEATGDEATRFAGTLGDPNYLAAGLVPAMAIAVGLAGGARGPGERWLLIGAAAVSAVGLAASGSRGGLVAAGVAVVATLVLVRGRRLQIGVSVALLVAVTGIWLAASSPETWDRIRTFEGGTGREDLWTIASRMSQDHPVVGVGLDNFEAESGEYLRQPGPLARADLIIEQPHVVHNVYLQQLAETGIVGLLLLLGVLLAATRASWLAAARFGELGDSKLAGLARATLVAQISALSASIFLSNGYDTRLWILLALGPALLAASFRSRVTGVE